MKTVTTELEKGSEIYIPYDRKRSAHTRQKKIREW